AFESDLPGNIEHFRLAQLQYRLVHEQLGLAPTQSHMIDTRSRPPRLPEHAAVTLNQPRLPFRLRDHSHLPQITIRQPGEIRALHFHAPQLQPIRCPRRTVLLRWRRRPACGCSSSTRIRKRDACATRGLLTERHLHALQREVVDLPCAMENA